MQGCCVPGAVLQKPNLEPQLGLSPLVLQSWGGGGYVLPGFQVGDLSRRLEGKGSAMLAPVSCSAMQQSAGRSSTSLKHALRT